MPQEATAQVVEVLTSDHFLSWRLSCDADPVIGSDGSWMCTVQDTSAAGVALQFGRMRWRLKKYIVFPMRHSVGPFWTLGILINFNWIKDVHIRGHPERHLHFRWIHFHVGCLEENKAVAATGHAYSRFLTDEGVDGVQQVYVPGLPTSRATTHDSGLFLAYYFKTWLHDYGGKPSFLIDNFMHEVNRNTYHTKAA